ncbi:Sec-independent protein translocase protein TatB [Marinimicrobium sp. ARAG 43.8]|uniref:Sec-independent protein translocase protein TatB n=1 Tax=Marinimicrobium sp. ARAG 43.8 TaxID=3418719 RepID=UPI003CF2548B
MFDIGFFELLVIAIVGLIVIGPERLPEAARAVGLWIGRLKRSLRETRSELERQIGADDIRRQLHNEEVMRSLEATRRQVQQAVEDGTKLPAAPTNHNAPTGSEADNGLEPPAASENAPDASSAHSEDDSSTPPTQPRP